MLPSSSCTLFLLALRSVCWFQASAYCSRVSADRGSGTTEDRPLNVSNSSASSFAFSPPLLVLRGTGELCCRVDSASTTRGATACSTGVGLGRRHCGPRSGKTPTWQVWQLSSGPWGAVRFLHHLRDPPVHRVAEHSPAARAANARVTKGHRDLRRPGEKTALDAKRPVVAVVS